MAGTKARPRGERDWRWFIAEYAVVFAGVLTALGAEQAAEALNHRHEAEDARRALKAELGFNLASFDITLALTDCSNRRLDELERWRVSWQEGRPLKLTAPIRGPAGRIFRTSVWNVAAVQGVAHMPFEERVAFGQFYDGVANNDDLRRRTRDAWNNLALYDGAVQLDRRQVMQIGHDLTLLRRLNDSVRNNGPFIHDYARKLGVVAAADPETPREVQLRQDLCRPLLQATP